MPEGLGDRALIEWTSKLMAQLFPEPVAAVTAS
jgi:hypothetical protein